MRRLPVFFLLDISESMAGENLSRLEDGVKSVIRQLRQNPHALESVFVSVICFAGAARTLAPLTSLAEFRPPELPIGGGTALEPALRHLMSEIDGKVVRGAAERKGDWKPIVFLLTDGRPTDQPAAAIKAWNDRYRSRTHLVAISIGGHADHQVLGQLTEDVLVLGDTGSEGFGRFINWISQSIQAQSRSVMVGQDAGVQLAKADDPIEKLDLRKRSEPNTVDDRYAVLVGRCQQNRLPYLMKYEKAALARSEDTTLADRLGIYLYQLRNTYGLKNSYFEFCGEQGPDVQVRSSQLVGQPSCPHCSAAYGLAVCSCGKIHCITGGGEQSCPWCGNRGVYASGDEDGFGITRGQG